MTSIYSTYDQLAELIASVAPQKVLALKASPSVQLRFEELSNKAKDGDISREEKDELDHFIVIERLMRLAKIRVKPKVECN